MDDPWKALVEAFPFPSDHLATFLAVVDAWGRGEVTGFAVLDAADAYLLAMGVQRD